MAMTKLTEYEIIPDVVDEFRPLAELKVEYPKVQDATGVVINSSKCTQKPAIRIIPANANDWKEGSLYTLCMVDPDAPTQRHPAFREWRHWVVVNMPIQLQQQGGGSSEDVSGDTLSEYQGPEPPQDSGTHRYVFMLFRQAGRLNLEPMSDIGNRRANFHVKEFARDNNLTLLACNFYLAHNEDKIAVVRSNAEALMDPFQVIETDSSMLVGSKGSVSGQSVV